MFTIKIEMFSRPSVLSDDLVQSERRCFAISELSCQFQQIFCTVLYENITVLDYQKFCPMGSENDQGFP
jgi:hypothetical protein